MMMDIGCKTQDVKKECVVLVGGISFDVSVCLIQTGSQLLFDSGEELLKAN